tara:strand:+ start:135 stop:425 length:291 start_codon:yes stop_codon:yes gene_type:complete
MNNLISQNWEILAGLLGSILAFFGGRKSKKQLEKTSELENLEKVRVIEKQLIQDVHEQVSQLIKYNKYLEGVVKEIKQQLSKYVDKYGELNESKKE